METPSPSGAIFVILSRTLSGPVKHIIPTISKQVPSCKVQTKVIGRVQYSFTDRLSPSRSAASSSDSVAGAVFIGHESKVGMTLSGGFDQLVLALDFATLQVNPPPSRQNRHDPTAETRSVPLRNAVMDRVRYYSR